MRLQFQTLLRAFSRAPEVTLPQERILHMLGTANHQVDRLNRLVDDMLDASRIHSGRLAMRTEPTDMTALITDVVERFGPQLQSAGCEVCSKIETGVRIVCDPFRAEQVLVNLISNVLKYAPGKPVTIQLWTEGSWARIQVRDQGIGIPAEKLPRIFERFERARTHEGVSGLGLGLYITRQIVQAHRGDISVESAEGMGSTFDVRFPLLT
jgi:signal transduction histidine kinase